jgi:CRISPR/Cas system-associated protein Csm6
MYIAGIITGVMFTSLVFLVLLGVIAVRVDDLLWRERAKKITTNRPTKVIIEDRYGNRRIAYEAETIDMRSCETTVP